VPFTVTFSPYCSKELIVPINKNKVSLRDKEIHLVTLESMGSAGSISEGSMVYLLDFAREFAKQKIHMHIYIRPNVTLKKSVLESFKENPRVTKTF